MESNYDKDCFVTPCPKMSCRKKDCCCGLTYINIPGALGDDSASSKVAPKNGTYSNAIVVYEANQAVYIYSAEGVPVKIEGGNNG